MSDVPHPKRQIDALQAARGIAALLVVLCHVGAFVGEEPSLWHRYGIYLWLRGGALGVQLFFVLSGIVIFRAHRCDIGRPSSIPAFYWKRFRRIYPLYWIFFVPTVLQHYAAHSANLAYQADPWVIASSAVLVHLFSIQTNMVVAWTLFDEVSFYLVFSTLLLHRKIGSTLFAIWLAVSVCCLWTGSEYWRTIFSADHLLFGFGILVAWIFERDSRIPARLILWFGVLIFAASLIAYGPFLREIWVRLAAGLGAAAILLGAMLLERRGALKTPSWLVFLGDASYSIYLVHFMAISAVARFCFAHRGAARIPIGAWILLLFAGGVAAGAATHMAIERPLLRILGKREKSGLSRAALPTERALTS